MNLHPLQDVGFLLQHRSQKRNRIPQRILSWYYSGFAGWHICLQLSFSTSSSLLVVSLSNCEPFRGWHPWLKTLWTLPSPCPESHCYCFFKQVLLLRTGVENQRGQPFTGQFDRWVWTPTCHMVSGECNFNLGLQRKNGEHFLKPQLFEFAVRKRKRCQKQKVPNFACKGRFRNYSLNFPAPDVTYNILCRKKWPWLAKSSILGLPLRLRTQSLLVPV